MRKDTEIPDWGRTAKSDPIINLMGIDSTGQIRLIIAATGEAEEGH